MLVRTTPSARPRAWSARLHVAALQLPALPLTCCPTGRWSAWAAYPQPAPESGAQSAGPDLHRVAGQRRHPARQGRRLHRRRRGQDLARCGPGGGTKMKLTLGPHARMQPCGAQQLRGPGAAGRRTPTCCRASPTARRTRATRASSPGSTATRRATRPWCRCHDAAGAGAQGARPGPPAPPDRAGGLQRLQAPAAPERRAPRAPAALPRRGALAASLPCAPLRRLLNAKCAYRPPPPPSAAAAGRRASAASRRSDEDQDEDAGPRERPEVLSLARELRTCSLRAAPAPPPPSQPCRWKAGPRERAGQAR